MRNNQPYYNIKMENGHQDTSEGNSESAEVDPYEKKYFALLKKCETTQQNNERLVNRLNYIKKMIRRLRHERRFLKRRLDKHEDEFRDIPLILSVDSGMDDDPNADLLAAPDYLPSAPLSHPQTNMAARSPSSALSTTLLSQIEPGSPPPSLAMWSSKASLSSSGGAVKKKCISEEKDRGVNKAPQNPYFLFTQDQTSPTIEGYPQTSKISYDIYNGEKDVWLYGASEDLNNTLTLEKNSVLLKENQGSLS